MKNNKLAETVRKMSKTALDNAVNKKLILVLHEPAVPAKVREFVKKENH